MSIAELDRIFPYICFGYGAVMSFALNAPALVRIADERLPEQMVAQWRGNKGFAMICLFVGAIWILQNLWLT